MHSVARVGEGSMHVHSFGPCVVNLLDHNGEVHADVQLDNVPLRLQLQMAGQYMYDASYIAWQKQHIDCVTQ